MGTLQQLMMMKDSMEGNSSETRGVAGMYNTIPAIPLSEQVPLSRPAKQPTSLQLLNSMIKEDGGAPNGASKKTIPKKVAVNRNLITMKREIEGIREEHPEVGLYRFRRFGTMVDTCARRANHSRDSIKVSVSGSRRLRQQKMCR